MSRKSKTSSKKQTATPDPDADQRAYVRDRMRQVLHIQRAHAADLIASGIFSGRDEWGGVIEDVAKPEAAATDAALVALFERLEAIEPGSTQLPNPQNPNDGFDMAAIDVVTMHFTAYMDAGFYVGLAVGMQLGPHAFDGIEAKGWNGGAR
jgi:hypothetical protein